MKARQTKKGLELIRDSYNEGLLVKWFSGDDHLRYCAELSVFTIERKDSNGYTPIISFSINHVMICPEDGSLMIVTNYNCPNFQFMPVLEEVEE